MRNDNPNLKKQIKFTTANHDLLEGIRSELKEREGVRPGPSRIANMAFDALRRELAERKPVTPERGRPFDAHAAA